MKKTLSLKSMSSSFKEETKKKTRKSWESGSSYKGTKRRAKNKTPVPGSSPERRRLSPDATSRTRYAVRSPFQSLPQEDEEKLHNDIMNFDPDREFSHHERCVTAIRLSSDMTDPFVVTAGLDCRIFVTDFNSGEVLKKIDTDNSFVFGLDISSDNMIFATAAQDGCVRIYSRRNNWRCIRVIRQQSPGICRIIWAVRLHMTRKGERYCVSGGATKVIHVYDWKTGDERCTLRGHQEGVRCLAIAQDGTLASGSNDYNVRLWNLLEGKFLFTLRGHSAEVNALCFMPNSVLLVTACENNIFRVWNYLDGTRLMIFDGYRGLSILSLSAVRGVNRVPWILVGGSHTKGYPSLNIEIWNVETGKKVANCRGCRYQICGIDMQSVFDEDGTESYVVVSGGLDCKTRCWSLNSVLSDWNYSQQEIVLDIDSLVASNSIVSAVTADSK